MKLVFDYLNFFGLAFDGGRLARVFFGFAYDLAAILLSNFELHHFFYVFHLIVAVSIGIDTIFLRVVLVSAAIAVPADTRVASSFGDQLSIISLFGGVLALVSVVLVLVFIRAIFETIRVGSISLVLSTLVSVSLFLSAPFHIA